jgi:hypothetical protein
MVDPGPRDPIARETREPAREDSRGPLREMEMNGLSRAARFIARRPTNHSAPFLSFGSQFIASIRGGGAAGTVFDGFPSSSSSAVPRRKRLGSREEAGRRETVGNGSGTIRGLSVPAMNRGANERQGDN